MKLMLIFVFALCMVKCFCQDSLKLKQIDSLVKTINQSPLKPQYDSIIQNHKELGLYMKTYLTMITDGRELIKYINKVHSSRQEKGQTKTMVGQNAFYFNKGYLIKVEEFLQEGAIEKTAHWYYWEGKSIYYTFQSEKSEARAAQLLIIADSMKQRIANK